MQRLKKIFLIIILTVLIVFLIFFVIRTVNGSRFATDAKTFTFYPYSQVDSYNRNVEGVTITKLSKDKLSGLHFKPKSITKKGVIVTLGGSEGGLLYNQSLKLAQSGNEVVALYYFGSPNMPELLDQVPIDFYQEFLTYCKTNCASQSPQTIVGYSKGTELAQLLATKYSSIENLVLYSPSHYVYQGLDQQNPASSWTMNGQDLPYISTHGADPGDIGSMFGNMLVNSPVSFRSLYQSALKNASNKDEAKIPVASSLKHVVMFVGGKDMLWPSDVMASEIKAAAGGRAEVYTYENAGHTFAGPGYNGITMTMTGGTSEANNAAKDASDKLLVEKISQWQPAAN